MKKTISVLQKSFKEKQSIAKEILFILCRLRCNIKLQDKIAKNKRRKSL